MKHSVSTLEGALLDAAVAKAEGWSWEIVPEDKSATGAELMMAFGFGRVSKWRDPYPFHPSRDWEDGGPIIERERITLAAGDEDWIASLGGSVEPGSRGHFGRGPTPLIAAMRAFVASVLGDEVELP